MRLITINFEQVSSFLRKVIRFKTSFSKSKAVSISRFLLLATNPRVRGAARMKHQDMTLECLMLRGHDSTIMLDIVLFLCRDCDYTRMLIGMYMYVASISKVRRHIL